LKISDPPVLVEILSPNDPALFDAPLHTPPSLTVYVLSFEFYIYFIKETLELMSTEILPLLPFWL
jgi:hypothetical protein